MIAERGKFDIGLVVDGVRHQDFELRCATLGDNVDALEELGAVSALRLSAAITARQLVRLGTLPQDKITTDLVLGLPASDYDALEAAQKRLKKRLLKDGQPWPGGSPSEPGASASASPSSSPAPSPQTSSST